MRMLISGDHGFVATALAFDSRPTRASNMATRRFVLAARRPSWQMTLYEIVDGVATPIADVPGDKEGSASMLVGVDLINLVYTSRAVGAPDGSPLHVWEHSVPVIGVWPIDVGAAARLRAITEILRQHLPAAAAQLAPFVS